MSPAASLPVYPMPYNCFNFSEKSQDGRQSGWIMRRLSFQCSQHIHGTSNGLSISSNSKTNPPLFVCSGVTWLFQHGKEAQRLQTSESACLARPQPKRYTPKLCFGLCWFSISRTDGSRLASDCSYCRLGARRSNGRKQRGSTVRYDV